MPALREIDPTAVLIKNVVVLDSEGKRIAVKYFSSEWSTVAEQAKYEETLFTKTSRFNSREEGLLLHPR